MRGRRVLLVAGIWAILTLFVPTPAGAAPAAFGVTGDFVLLPGSADVQSQLIVLNPVVLKTKVDLPAALAADVSRIESYDPQSNLLPCAPLTGQPSYVCGTGQASQPLMAVRLYYQVPQVEFGTWAQYPKTYDITVTDLASKAKGTVHTTVKPTADLALHGPFASNLGLRDAGIMVYIEDIGPSDSQSSVVTFRFTGAYTTFTFPNRDVCTVSGPVVTCPLTWLRAGTQVPVTVVLGHDSGVFSVTARVVGADSDPVTVDNGDIGGPWNLFPGNGSAAGTPPPPPANAPRGGGVPAPAPVPSASSGAAAPSPVPADPVAAIPAPVPAHGPATTASWPLSHYLAIAFLCASSAYLAVAGVVWLGRRRRSANASTDLNIDLDR